MNKKKIILNKLLKILGLAALILVFILYIALPIGFGFFSTLRFPHKVGTPPQGFIEVNLKTNDKINLKAWYKKPENSSVIILLHGSTSSREAIRSHARMLAGNGYGVLSYDLRGHGESGGKGNAYGWSGTKDLGAALGFLKKEHDVKSIGGLGLSLGGEILLGASSTYPELKAIIADGATSRSTGDYIALPKNKSLVRNYSTRLAFKTVSIIRGQKPPEILVESIKAAKNTKFMFIAAGNPENEIEFGNNFMKSASKGSELWVVPGVNHTKAFSKYPIEYEKRVIEFFKEGLGG